MPDPVVAPENKAAPAPVAVDAAALGASIADGITKNLAPILERQSQAPRQEPVPSSSAPAALPEPTYEEIAEAQEGGDFKKANQLMRQRERARDARNASAFDQLRNQGATALGSMAKQSASSLPAYQRYPKEVDAMIEDFVAKNPGVMVTPEHYRTASDIIMGRHVDDIANERTEAAIRKSRETPAIEPGDETGEEHGEKLPSSVAEEFAGTPFLQQFKQKARAKGGLSFEQDVQTMNRGIKAARMLDDKGRPKNDYTEKDYLKERREMAAFAEDNPHLGLDE